MNPPSPQSTHIPILDHLRGLAALLVFVGHFGALVPVVVIGEELVRLTECGAYGVEMFFAISGFVIPYSMYCRGHTIGQSWTFLLRRMARLEPPYLACIGLVLCLNAITASRAGAASIHPEIRVTMPQLLAHVGYLNALLGFRWLNVVFWTLAIEFQFYLSCIVAFPLISSHRASTRILSLLTLALLGFISTGTRDQNPPLLAYWLPLFAMGMTAYCFMTHQLSRLQAGAVFATVAAIAVAVNGPVSMAFAAFPLCAIVLLNFRQPWKCLRPMAWMGTVSYSFYLLHLPIGLRMAAHLRNHLPAGPVWECLSLALIFLAVVGSSYVFYRLIEKPAQEWSKSIGRRPSSIVTANAFRAQPDFYAETHLNVAGVGNNTPSA